MTALDELLARIKATLTDCDATQLPPLDLTTEEFDWLQAANPSLGLPVDQAVIEASRKRRSWLVRWLPRRAQP